MAAPSKKQETNQLEAAKKAAAAAAEQNPNAAAKKKSKKRPAAAIIKAPLKAKKARVVTATLSTASASASVPSPAWQADLQSFSDKLKNQQAAIAGRIKRETTGSVPSVMQPGETDETLRCEASREIMSASDARLLSLEHRMAELESSAVADRRWARSMGTFLYEANEKTLGMMKDMLGVLATVKKMCACALEGQQ